MRSCSWTAAEMHSDNAPSMGGIQGTSVLLRKSTSGRRTVGHTLCSPVRSHDPVIRARSLMWQNSLYADHILSGAMPWDSSSGVENPFAYMYAAGSPILSFRCHVANRYHP